MKRLFAIILLICVLSSCALAETLDSYLENYNIMAAVVGARELNASNATVTNLETGDSAYLFPGQPSVLVYTSFDGFACVGTDDGPFLRTAVALMLAKFGTSDILTVYSNIFSDYIMRRDVLQYPALSGDWAYGVTMQNGAYRFVLTKYR